jgi:hypothetical protein
MKRSAMKPEHRRDFPALPEAVQVEAFAEYANYKQLFFGSDAKSN